MKNRTIKIIDSSTVEKDIPFLIDADVEFISLVKHGANRVPFTIVKSENRGGMHNTMIIQSILVPKGQNFDALSSEDGLGWIVDAAKDKFESFDEYDKYTQIPVTKFDQNSMNMVKLHDSGVWAVVGKVANDEKVNNPIILGKKEIEKYMQIPVAPGNSVVAEIHVEPQPITFNQVFEQELYNFLEVVRGTLAQTKSTPAQRRKSILGALDAFKSFLLMGLDAIAEKNKSIKKDGELSKLDEKISQITKILKTLEKGGDIMFKTKEDFEKAVSEYLTKIEAEKAAKEKEEAEKAAKEKEEAEKAAKEKEEAEKAAKEKEEAEKAAKEKEEAKSLLTKIDKMAEEIKSITEKQDKFENQLITYPAANGKDASTIEKTNTKSVSVFSGILDNKID